MSAPSGGRSGSRSPAANPQSARASPKKRGDKSATKGDRSPRSATKKPQQQNVLLGAKDLEAVVKDVTGGGKKKLGGLYMPNGHKLEVRADDNKISSEAKVKNEKANQNLNLNNVAKKYGEREKKKRENWEKNKQKDENNIGDAEQARRAQKIWEQTPETEKIEFQELFQLFDVDKDRTWGSIEVAQVMVDLGHACTVEQAANMLYFAGVRDIDEITWSDFVCMMPKLGAYRRLLEREAMEAFAASDENRNGTLGREEVRNALSILGGGDVDEQQLEDLIDAADVQHTGEITYPDFMIALFGVRPTVKYEPAFKPPLITRFFRACCGGAGSKAQENAMAANQI